MKSIRSRLLFWLAPGFLGLWIVAGAAIDSAARARLDERLEADLRELLGAIPFGSGPGSSLIDLEDFARDDFGIYFQVWARDGMRLLKSNNLGWFDLRRPESFSESPSYGRQLLGNGDSVHTLAVRRESPGLGAVEIVVAKSREAVDAAIWRMRLTILLIGAGAAAGFALLVILALRSGLRPLTEVGDRVAEIDAGAFGVRFPENLPAELRPIATKLNDLTGRLEASFARERQFSADVAHELRTPLATMRANAEYGLKWPDEFSGDELREIHALTGEMEATVENLLALAELENASAPVSTEPVALRSLAEACWKPFSSRAAERGLIFRNQLDDESEFETDPRLLRIIVSNLLSNAASYAPQNSEIRLDAAGCLLRVSNPAPDLRPEDLPKLFDRFWRRDPSRADAGHSGLGLALARSCAEALKLELRAELDDSGVVHFCLETPKNAAA